MKPPNGELAAAGSGGISAVSLIALAHRYGVQLDPTVAGYLALAAGWIGARVRRYLAGETDPVGQHAVDRREPARDKLSTPVRKPVDTL